MRHLTTEERDMRAASKALAVCGSSVGYLVHADEKDMLTVCTSLGQPFYKVRLVVSTSRGKKRVCYDVGQQIVSTPNRAIQIIRTRRLIW